MKFSSAFLSKGVPHHHHHHLNVDNGGSWGGNSDREREEFHYFIIAKYFFFFFFLHSRYISRDNSINFLGLILYSGLFFCFSFRFDSHCVFIIIIIIPALPPVA